MTTDELLLSPRMEAVITQLAESFSVDLSQPGASLTIALPDQPYRWLVKNLDGARMSVTRCAVEGDGLLSLELDMVFVVHPVGWEPVELLRTPTLWERYEQEAKAAGISVYDDDGGIRFDRFTEYWAQQLEAQGWLTRSQRLPDALWPPVDDEQPVRMAGCQSTHPGPCYGDLWQCAACGKTVCCAEGTDNHRELCDDCWVALQAPPDEYNEEENDVPF